MDMQKRMINSGETRFMSEKASHNESTGEIHNSKAGAYVRELLQEKQSLDVSCYPNAVRLLDEEVTKEVAQVQLTGKFIPKDVKYVDLCKDKPIRVAVKILVPIKEYPQFNFVGKLLGPKGSSLKKLQENTLTKMSVLGRGSMKDKSKEEELRSSLDPKYSHLSDELHVEIVAYAFPAEAHARIAYALAELRKFLIPESSESRPEMYDTMASGENGMPGGTSSGRGNPRGRIARGGRGGGRGGILSQPHPLPPPPPGTFIPGAHPPLGAPPQPLLPRPPAAKNKVLSILDRARVAMEESYRPDDSSSGPPGMYDSFGYSGSGYGGEEFDDNPGNFYNANARFVSDGTGSLWKRFKSPGAPPSGAGGLVPSSGRFRQGPYSRPPK